MDIYKELLRFQKNIKKWQSLPNNGSNNQTETQSLRSHSRFDREDEINGTLRTNSTQEFENPVLDYFRNKNDDACKTAFREFLHRKFKVGKSKSTVLSPLRNEGNNANQTDFTYSESNLFFNSLQVRESFGFNKVVSKLFLF